MKNKLTLAGMVVNAKMPLMTHRCEICHLLFEIRPHSHYRLDDKQPVEINTVLNMVYGEDQKHEYAKCPACGTVESIESMREREYTIERVCLENDSAVVAVAICSIIAFTFGYLLGAWIQ